MGTTVLPETQVSEANAALRPGPLFVVGMWRSGTSLLYALLNQHSQISLMYEAELPVLRPLFFLRGGKSDWARRWNFWNSAIDRHQISAGDLPESVNTLPEAVRAVYGRYARRKNATIWGGKSPNYYDFLKLLARQFPRAQFIVIWRDPADICRSILRAASQDTWFSKRGVPHRALFGLHRMKKECEQLAAQGVAVHEINYEDLIHRTPEVMHGICRFLDIPFEARMTTLEGADRSAIYAGEHHEGVKSEKIREKKPRPEVLPPDLKRKIQRYTALWRRQYNNTWPPAPANVDSGQLEMPGVLERVKDHLIFRAYRVLDAAVVVVYCFAPIALLSKYRAAKAQKADSVQNVQPASPAATER